MDVRITSELTEKELEVVYDFAKRVNNINTDRDNRGTVVIDDIAVGITSGSFACIVVGTAADDPFFYSFCAAHLETVFDFQWDAIAAVCQKFKVGVPEI